MEKKLSLAQILGFPEETPNSEIYGSAEYFEYLKKMASIVNQVMPATMDIADNKIREIVK